MILVRMNFDINYCINDNGKYDNCNNNDTSGDKNDLSVNKINDYEIERELQCQGFSNNLCLINPCHFILSCLYKCN